VKKPDKKYDELIFRKPSDKVEKILRDEILKTRLAPKKRNKEVMDFLITKLRNSIPIQIVIGTIACFLLYLIIGGIKFIQTMLTLIIGMTLVSAFLSSILSKYQRRR
jgi:hypothetical protein